MATAREQPTREQRADGTQGAVAGPAREGRVFCPRHGGSWLAKIARDARSYGLWCHVCSMTTAIEVTR